MRHPTPRRTPTASARRAGYVIAVAVNAIVLYAANVWPGWPAVGFLNLETALVMGLVNASLIIGIAANLCYLAADPPWLKALGSVITTAVGIAALVRIWQVFPFDFDDSTIDWTLIARTVLVVSIVGSVIGILVAVVGVIKNVVAPAAGSTSRPPADVRQ